MSVIVTDVDVIGDTEEREVLKFLRLLEKKGVSWKQAAEGQEIGKLILLCATDTPFSKQTLRWVEDHAEQYDLPVVVIDYSNTVIQSDCITIRFDGTTEQDYAVTAIAKYV
jgi:hypothetical protein